MAEKKREYSCHECGHPYTVNPPDDIHTMASLDKGYANMNSSGKVIKMTYICKNCKKPTTLYWFRQKMRIRTI